MNCNTPRFYFHLVNTYSNRNDLTRTLCVCVIIGNNTWSDVTDDISMSLSCRVCLWTEVCVTSFKSSVYGLLLVRMREHWEERGAHGIVEGWSVLCCGVIRGVLDPLERRPRQVAIAFVPEVHVMVLMIVHQFCIDKLRPFQVPRPPIPFYPSVWNNKVFDQSPY